MMTFNALSDMCLRQHIDSDTLFREVLRVQKELRGSDDVRITARLKSLQKVQDEYERVNKALRLGSVSERVVKLLNEWELAGQEQLVLGCEALHVYAGLACVRTKKSPGPAFRTYEHKQANDQLKAAVESGALRPNRTAQVVFARSGRMGLMHVLGPLSFVAFKKWLIAQPERSAKQIQQDRKQVDLVEQLIELGLLSSTFDKY
nr:hypothetical protein [uncultured Rhodoferax sp.]